MSYITIGDLGITYSEMSRYIGILCRITLYGRQNPIVGTPLGFSLDGQSVHILIYGGEDVMIPLAAISRVTRYTAAVIT